MEQKELLQLSGSVEEIVFRNANNGYTVLTMLCDGSEVTAVGNMSDVNVGDELKLTGTWKNHANYGEQFAFEYYEQCLPSGAASILKYLSSGVIKGIGRATAKRLVDEFGDDTLEVMQKQPERLAQIRGISKEKALAISAEIQRAFGMREVMMYLEKYHITPKESVQIWKQLGADAVSLIEANPYILCMKDIGVSFERADTIAAALGKSEDDTFRIRAGTQFIIAYNAGNGHTCLPRERLMNVTADYLRLTPEQINAAISEMITDGTVTADMLGEREFIFLPDYYRSESYAAQQLGIMLKFPPERIVGAEAALEAFEKRQGIEYAALQRKAIVEALSGGMLILTGGPGTGKTTALNAIIELYEACGIKVALAAPTGRAAQRMSEVTGREAKTIHRLLEVEWDNNDRPLFKRNERNLLSCDALILDEMSMVDAALFEGVVRALPIGCRLIMVGDTDQLPSVGAGNILGDLIASGKIPVVQLTEIFRQSMQSLIVTNAHRIVHGEMPELHRTDSDFFFMACGDREKIASTIVDLCTTRLPATYHYSPLCDIQVLCPGRKGELGVMDINKRLQQVLNPPDTGKPEINMPVYTLRKGDKVMQTKNNYDLVWTKSDGTDGTGVYNGDIGMIEDINKSSKTALVRFDDKLVIYDHDAMISLDLAYAATVHKSQGNEFNAVIIPMYYGAPQLCYRNLLYTAVTRAKKLLILVGNVGTLRKMVENNRKTLRYSALKTFMERQ